MSADEIGEYACSVRTPVDEVVIEASVFDPEDSWRWIMILVIALIIVLVLLLCCCCICCIRYGYNPYSECTRTMPDCCNTLYTTNMHKEPTQYMYSRGL